eukprot:g14435.t1
MFHQTSPQTTRLIPPARQGRKATLEHQNRSQAEMFKTGVFLLACLSAHGLQGFQRVGVKDAGHKNVFGGELQTCSRDGEATTGWFRDGHCTDGADDHGSHHICIQMEADFCIATGQSNWCTKPINGKPIGHWCVCQWAYASYLQAKGGNCQAFSHVDCQATNMQALLSYRQQAPNDASIANALKCLEQVCSIPHSA